LGRRNSLSHPQQRAEIVAPISDVDDLFESLQTSVRGQPLLKLVPLAHVDETSDLAGVLVWRVFGDETTYEEGVRGGGVPVGGVGDDVGEEVGEAVVLWQRPG
jgi:hypothetical protein